MAQIATNINTLRKQHSHNSVQVIQMTVGAEAVGGVWNAPGAVSTVVFVVFVVVTMGVSVA